MYKASKYEARSFILEREIYYFIFLNKSFSFFTRILSTTTITVIFLFSISIQAGELLGKNQAEEVLVALSPLLEKSHPPPSLCRFFSRYCRSRPRCPLVAQLFTPVVRRALKHNVVINCSTISLTSVFCAQASFLHKQQQNGHISKMKVYKEKRNLLSLCTRLTYHFIPELPLPCVQCSRYTVIHVFS